MILMIFFSGESSDDWRVSVVKSGCFSTLLDLPTQFIPKVFDISVLLLSSGIVYLEH